MYFCYFLTNKICDIHPILPSQPDKGIPRKISLDFPGDLWLQIKGQQELKKNLFIESGCILCLYIEV